MARLKFVMAGIITSLFAVFLMSDNIHATSNVIDFTSTSGFGAYGFCANNRQWEYGSLKYTGYSWNVSSHITKSFTTGNYNQIAFNTNGCSNTPWGVYTILLNVRSVWGLSDGKYINIDLVSNNSGFPFFNGSVVYGYESGTGAVIPGYIDKRTYDVKMQKNSTTWLSGRDQVGSQYSMKYDEIEVIEGQPAYLHHLQFSIPYHASEFTSNGVSNLEIATSQWLVEAGNNGSHFQEFGSVQSPLFYLDSISVSSTTSMFWLYVSVSDEAEFDSASSVADASDQFYENENNAINDISGQTPADLNVGNSQTATNLIGYITNFISYIGTISPASDCNIELQFPSYAGGTIVANLCQFKDNFGTIISVFSSLVLIVFYIPLAYKMLSVIYSEIRSFTNG